MSIIYIRSHPSFHPFTVLDSFDSLEQMEKFYAYYMSRYLDTVVPTWDEAYLLIHYFLWALCGMEHGSSSFRHLQNRWAYMISSLNFTLLARGVEYCTPTIQNCFAEDLDQFLYYAPRPYQILAIFHIDYESRIRNREIKHYIKNWYTYSGKPNKRIV